jgi:hypothetical protein
MAIIKSAYQSSNQNLPVLLYQHPAIRGSTWARVISESLPELTPQWNTDRTVLRSFLIKYKFSTTLLYITHIKHKPVFPLFPLEFK